MAKKMVKCKYCGQQFDRNAEPFVAVSSRRYAHQKCAEEYENKKSQEEKDLRDLEEYIKYILKEDYINVKVRTQMKTFREQYNYTYSGMLGTLKWWYEVKHNSTDLAQGGIGIIPYKYKDAYLYYSSLEKAKNINNDLIEFHPRVQEITISSPRTNISTKKLFNLGEE